MIAKDPKELKQHWKIKTKLKDSLFSNLLLQNLLQNHSNQNSVMLEKDRHKDSEWNRTESLEINPCINGQMIFYKDDKTI